MIVLLFMAPLNCLMYHTESTRFRCAIPTDCFACGATLSSDRGDRAANRRRPEQNISDAVYFSVADDECHFDHCNAEPKQCQQNVDIFPLLHFPRRSTCVNVTFPFSKYFQAILWSTFGFALVKFFGFVYYMVSPDNPISLSIREPLLIPSIQFGASFFRLARLCARARR